MSLFRDERPVVSQLRFDPQTLPTAGTVSGGSTHGPTNGTIWYDNGNSLQSIVGNEQAGFQVVPAIQQLAAAVTNTNPTSATALMTYVFPAGALSAVGRNIELFAAGEITTGTGTTTTIAVTLGDGTNTRTAATWTTGALTTAQTALPWEVNLYIATAVAGSSGKVFGHGALAIPLTAPTAAASTYLDQIVANSSTLDLTKAITLTVTSLFGTGNASNSVTQDFMFFSISN